MGYILLNCLKQDKEVGVGDDQEETCGFAALQLCEIH